MSKTRVCNTHKNRCVFNVVSGFISGLYCVGLPDLYF